MASQWIFLGLNDSATKLAHPFSPGQSIYFVSTSFDSNPDPNPVIDNSSVNLVFGDDILLHISVRRRENRIIFDTRRGNTWDNKLQVIDIKDVFPGPGAIIRVDSNASSYDVSFNNSARIHTFPKRIDANATAVSYNANDQRRVFSNPIVALVFDNGEFISLPVSPPPLISSVYEPFFDISYASEGVQHLSEEESTK